MLICSFNVKDLGGSTKRRKVRDLILANSLEFVVIQKTKLLLVSDILVHSIWGNTFYKWNFFLLLVIIVCVCVRSRFGAAPKRRLFFPSMVLSS